MRGLNGKAVTRTPRQLKGMSFSQSFQLLPRVQNLSKKKGVKSRSIRLLCTVDSSNQDYRRSFAGRETVSRRIGRTEWRNFRFKLKKSAPKITSARAVLTKRVLQRSRWTGRGEPNVLRRRGSEGKVCGWGKFLPSWIGVWVK